MRLLEFDGTTQQAMLYHGTKDEGLDVLLPRESELVGEPVVFAATFLDVCVAMAGHWTDDDFEFGRVGQDRKGEMVRYHMKEKRAGAFEEFFLEPTYVYLLPPEGFEPHRAIQDFEVVARQSVEPISYLVIRDPMEFLRSSPVVKIIPLTQ